MLACATGSLPVVEALLRVGGVEAAGAHGLTALDIAATMGHSNVVEVLLTCCSLLSYLLRTTD